MIITTNLPPRPEDNLPSWKKLNPGIKTADGREHPDPIPMEPPINYVRQPHLWETIRDMVRSEALAQRAREAGRETFEEAEDFDIEDDDHPTPDPPVFLRANSTCRLIFLRRQIIVRVVGSK